MNFKDLNPRSLTKLTAQLLDHVTCLECCKYYKCVCTAWCGHSLCGSCWAGRRSCPSCGSARGRRPLTDNAPLQVLTDHVAALAASFEKLFNVTMQEFMMEATDEQNTEMDPNINVKQWLTSSQNHFSAPVTNSQDSQPVAPIQLSTSNIQIHTSCKKSITPTKVLHVIPQQDDWDKIEVLPETENIVTTDKENMIGSNIEPFLFDENEYNNDHPRRSSRKKEKQNEVKEISVHSKTSNADSEKKSIVAPQTWNNVKKMRKEFSKLNKKNKNKLNVSIEMCKKTQNSNKKATVTPPVLSQLPTYTIDEDTPDILPPDENQLNHKQVNNRYNDKVSEIKSTTEITRLANATDSNLQTDMEIDYDEVIEKVNENNKINENISTSVNLCQKIISQSKLNNRKLSLKNNAITLMPFIKKSALCRKASTSQPSEKPADTVAMHQQHHDTDDIEITIKIGSTITNIVINKKHNDVKLKVNSDKEIQTSLAPSAAAAVATKVQTSAFSSTDSGVKHLEMNICGKNDLQTQVSLKPEKMNNVIVKSTSTKKNTASAETATAQFEITESVEREISDIMECVENKQVNINTKGINKTENKLVLHQEETKVIPQDVELLNEDIFASGSVKEVPVQVLSSSNSMRSEILLPTSRTQKDKRQREVNENDITQKKKKMKQIPENHMEATLQDSEGMNYDAVMGAVFANIDKDIEFIKSQKIDKNTQIVKTQILSQSVNKEKSAPAFVGSQTQNSSRSVNKSIMRNVDVKMGNEKFSENIFSLLERDSEMHMPTPHGNKQQVPGPETQKHIERLLTPRACEELGSVTAREELGSVTAREELGSVTAREVLGSVTAREELGSVTARVELGSVTAREELGSVTAREELGSVTAREELGSVTAREELGSVTAADDDDHSVVEDTPHKNISIGKITMQKAESAKPSKIEAEQTKSVIDLVDSDTSIHKLNNTDKNKLTLETPLNINKFFDHVTYKSTPVARKSLNFNNEDTDKTLCPTASVPQTTQEKEFLAKAFESQNITAKCPSLKNMDYCLAGSCLSAVEVARIKSLCGIRGWTFVDKYCDQLTHLIVGVDEDGRAQRSVKYMRALAASKWILTMDWIQRLLNHERASEEEFEALDMSGAPGPRLSREARARGAPRGVGGPGAPRGVGGPGAPRGVVEPGGPLGDGGLFAGITFYCMPPFSVLELHDLEAMLVSAGGRVVEGPRGVAGVAGVADPSLLLAEPGPQHADRFTYLALELGVVPVNFEWVLECLGSYSLRGLRSQLLAPAALLPPAAALWPAQLLDPDDDSTPD